jgi:hypothetical protein
MHDGDPLTALKEMNKIYKLSITKQHLITAI